MRIAHCLMILATTGLLAGCPKRPATLPDSTPAQAGAGGGAGTVGTVGGGEQLTAEQLALAELERTGMIVYFDYDRSEIRPEYVGLVGAHARYLSGNPARRVRLEGHADERGTREYNIGLGERRAQAVRRALMLQGVSDAQITTVSYGEERPAVAGSSEDAYSRNRRVEFSYPGN